MSIHTAVPQVRIERETAAAVAGSRMAAANPSVEDVEAGRRILAGEVSADEVVRQRLAQIDAQFAVTR